MKCPACFNELTQKQVGRLTVEVCKDGCGGIWFDAFEMEQVDEEEEAAGESLLDITRDDRVLVDRSRKRDCPRCEGVKLHRHFFSAARRVEVDQCPNCGGYWLDAGELAEIRAEKNAVKRTSEASQRIRSSEVIRYLFRLQAATQRRETGSPSPENAVGKRDTPGTSEVS